MIEFIGTCVHLPVHRLDEYDESSRDITHRTFRKHVGPEMATQINTEMGYGDCPRLSLATDWSVSFSKGKWRGKKAVCVMHSSIHHIWTT